MVRGAAQSLADALDRIFRPSLGRYFQTEAAGNGVEAGGIEWNAAVVDGCDQLPGPGVVVQNGR